MSSIDPRLPPNAAVLLNKLISGASGQSPEAAEKAAKEAEKREGRDDDDDVRGHNKHHPGSRQAAGTGGTRGPVAPITDEQSQGQTGQGEAHEHLTTEGSESSAFAAGLDPAAISQLAQAGLSGIDTSQAQRAPGTNKFGSDQAILQNPAPLPPDAPRLTQRTQQLYTGMTQDIGQALTEASGGSEANNSLKEAAANYTTVMKETTGPELNTRQGAVKNGRALGTLSDALTKDMSMMVNGDALAAFLMLTVVNRQSGKEVMSALQGVLTKARNNQIAAQIKQQQAAAEQAKEAQKKMELMKKLGPLIEAIVTAIMVAVTALSFGSLGPAMFALGAAALGFIVGGAVGGSKNGNGFDLGSAATGMGIGAAFAQLAMAPLKLIISGLVKVLETVGLRTMAKALEKSMEKVLAKLGGEVGEIAGKKGVSELSAASKYNKALQAGTSAVGIGSQLAIAIENYLVAMKNLKAKEHQAAAKEAKVIAEAMQNAWESIQGALSGLLQHHEQNVNQMQQMLSSHHQADVNSVAGIAR